jgi:hypothetical protein
MRIWLDLLDHFVEQLAEKGQDLSKAALEALAIDAYRMNRISGYQLGQLLEIPSRYELDGVLIQIWSNDPRARCPPIRRRSDANSAEALGDFERESATSAPLWQKRQGELAAERDLATRVIIVADPVANDRRVKSE